MTPDGSRANTIPTEITAISAQPQQSDYTVDSLHDGSSPSLTAVDIHVRPG